jgi:glycosyltransferase involved in cell wall biosynthesis
VGKWEPRKNQHVLIGAFLNAFSPEDDVELVLKVTPYWRADGYPPTAEASIGLWAKRFDSKWSAEQIARHVKVIWNEHLSRQDMSELYASCHAYVQSGRSEGFDLCALDAKVAGLRLVGVFWGGPSQFQTESDITVPWIDRRPPPAGYNAPEGVSWPAPSIDMYANALRMSFSVKLAKVPEFDVRPYMIDAVGAQLRETCRQLAAYVGVDLSDLKAE